MGVFVLYHALGDLAGEGIGYRDIDVVSRNGKGLNQDGLNQEACHQFAFGQGLLEIVAERREESTGEGHVGHHAKIGGTGGEALFVLHLHPGQPG